ncbi:Cytochrome P450 [Sergentomyia squamirostris]
MTFALYELAQHQDLQDKARNEVLRILAKYNGEYTYEACMEMKYVDQVINETLRKYPNQEVQAKAREEVNRVLENHGGQYTYDACMEMKYIDQIIKETLRLHPIVPNLIRSLTMDYKVPDRDITFKKGQMFSIPVMGIHHDPDIYPNPEQFDPERFTEENIRDRHSYSWLPFGEGPRNCIGLRFGMMQTRVGLANILSKYKITPTSRTPIPMSYSPTSAVLAPREGMWIKIEKA